MALILEFIALFCITIYAYLEAFVKLFIPQRKKSVSEDIVLITGSGHGIGRLVALEFARLQSIVVLWDINKISAITNICFFVIFAFSASKFGAVGFHECMTAELASLGKDGIKTSCLCPVFVNTGFVQKPNTRLWPVLKPEDVSRSFVDGILTNKKMILVPSYVKTYLVLEKFLPQRVIDRINKMQDVQFSTDLRSASKTK
ncbi:PREDICTED: 17-beta-hydroxysteroid dehydrogenase 13-like [Nanorana parkeri]|uniref:17-beta-hydroxysteroid dehydrogenase 13-like n=1 Tax=Nanorana parkeri TaxID=125878 RepID=UPI000854B7D4|nr:PREDICTED: 17-beta-hydroxysteroid dehydrogenase 13-like [Nanorana parkeri]